jgi:hypothetical protein
VHNETKVYTTWQSVDGPFSDDLPLLVIVDVVYIWDEACYILQIKKAFKIQDAFVSENVEMDITTRS